MFSFRSSNLSGAPMSETGRFASPPCLASEIAPDYFDPLAVDAEQARDVARWRRAERARLSALRDTLGAAGRGQVSMRIGGHLCALLSGWALQPGCVLSGVLAESRHEPDLRARPDGSAPRRRDHRPAGGRNPGGTAGLSPLDARDADASWRVEHPRSPAQGRGADP